MGSIGAYAKSIVALTSGVLTALAPYYGSEKWFAALTAGLGVILVYAIPNQKPPGSV